MIYLKTDEEIELLRESNLLVSRTLAEVAKLIRPGCTTKQLDITAEQFIRDNNAIPAFLGYRDFPGTLCTSVNDQVVHGVPGEYVLQEGDIISIDCGVLKNGFVGDSAYTFCVGRVAPEVITLLKTTKEALYAGIEMAVPGKRVGDIGYAVQEYCEARGYSVVREMIGHGVGKELHEKPDIPNYGNRGSGAKLASGMVLAIEPMINMGNKQIVIEKDEWTARTKDRKPSAHFEHSVVVRYGKADILSTFEFIEEVLGDNAI